jgi:hypothetical protein
MTEKQLPAELPLREVRGGADEYINGVRDGMSDQHAEDSTLYQAALKERDEEREEVERLKQVTQHISPLSAEEIKQRIVPYHKLLCHCKRCDGAMKSAWSIYGEYKKSGMYKIGQKSVVDWVVNHGVVGFDVENKVLMTDEWVAKLKEWGFGEYLGNKEAPFCGIDDGDEDD